MSDTANETKARELLKRFVLPVSDGTFNVKDCQDLLKDAEQYLRETEPKHAAVVAWEEWWGKSPYTYAIYHRTAFLAGYKAGQLATLPMVAGSKTCSHCGWADHDIRQRIRDAAEKVPSA